MDQLVDRFLTFKEHSQGVSPGTVVKYRGYLNRLIRFLSDSDQTVLDVERSVLEHFCGLYMHQQGLSPRARRPLVSSVRGFFAWLKREGLRTDDPGTIIEYPRVGRRLPAGMSLKSAETLLLQPDLETFTGIRDAAMIAVLIGCGVRVSGLVSLNEGDLLFMAEGGLERLVIRVREKGGHERLIPAPQETLLYIRAYLGRSELDPMDRSLDDGDKVLFVSTRNRNVSADKYHGEARRIATRTVNDMLVKYGEAAGVPREQLHPHAIRHLYGTEMAEEGVDVLLIQALMGHQDPKTSQTYVHLATRSLAKTVDRANPLRKMNTPVTVLARSPSRKIR